MATSESNWYLAYNTKLKTKLESTFEFYVDPSNVLHMFHRYDDNVLTKQDMQSVTACTNSHGSHTGARLLLEKLICYENWFECLMKVLRDKGVKLSHAADKMQEIRDSFDLEYGRFNRQNSAGNPKLTERKVLQSDFNLNEPDGIEGDSATDNKRGKKQSPGSLVPRTEGDGTEKTVAEAMGTVDGISENTDSSNYANIQFSPTLSSAVMPDRAQNEHSLGQGDDQKEKHRVSFNVDPGAGETSGEEYRAKHKKKNSRTKPVSHGPEYDFTLEDVEAEIGHLQGWIPDITETEIYQKLNPATDQDGSFILWYWATKKRPAICVIDEGEIKTMIVHKKPARQHKSRNTTYFITKNERRESLREIVEYHIENGINDMTPGREQEIIYFHNPISA